MTTTEPPITPATAAEWRRRRDAFSDPDPADYDTTAGGGIRVPAYTATVRSQDIDPEAQQKGAAESHQAAFAETQQAGLTAMLSIAAGASPRPRPAGELRPLVPQVPGSPPGPSRDGTPAGNRAPARNGAPSGNGAPARPGPTITAGVPAHFSSALVIERPAIPVLSAPETPARATAEAPGGPEPAAGRQGGDGVTGLRALPLIVILTVQAFLSLRLITRNTAFTDEALYLWAGRLEWSHWLHHTLLPPFASYFSGAPVLYPPIGALANSLGGLAGARVLSLCFMLGATVLLHGVARRIYDRLSAAFAAALFAGLGSAQFLGAFATYDAMALFLLATATWLGIRAAGCRTTRRRLALILLAAVALVIADAAKYAAAPFDPVVFIAVACFHWRELGRRAATAAGLLVVGGTAAGIAIALALGGRAYVTGIAITTLSRAPGNWPIFGILFVSAGWVGVIAALAVLGALVASWGHRSAPERALAWTLAAAAFLAPAEQARIHVFTSLFKHVAFGGWFAAVMAGYALTAFIRAVPMVKARGAFRAVTAVVALATVAGSMLAVNQFGTWPGVTPVLPALTATLRAHPGSLLTDQTAPLDYYLEDFEPWQNVATIQDSSISQDVRQRRFTYILLSFAIGGGGCGNADPAVRETQSQCLHFIDLHVLYNIINDRGYTLIARIPYRVTSFKSVYMLWARQRPQR